VSQRDDEQCMLLCSLGEESCNAFHVAANHNLDHAFPSTSDAIVSVTRMLAFAR